MKCNSLIGLKKSKGKKPKLVPYWIISPYLQQVEGLSPYSPRFAKDDIEIWEVCDGDVYPVVDMESDGGGCSCCSSEYIECKFLCNKCKLHHPQFPTDQDFLNSMLKDLCSGKSLEQISDEQMKICKDRYEKQQEMAKKLKGES